MSLSYPYLLPLYRYTVWSDLPIDTQSAASSLGYVEDTWNYPSTEGAPASNNLEILAFSSLNSKQENDAAAIGFSEETWDCWVNHYTGYGWEELEEFEIAPLWAALGWDEISWQGLAEPPLSASFTWTDLTVEEQEVAASLCYIESTWDGLRLNDTAFVLPDIGSETLSPTGAPSFTPGPTGTPSPSATPTTPPPTTLSPTSTPTVSSAPTTFELYRFALPAFRFKKWGDLSENIKNTARNGLDYGASTWNKPSLRGEPFSNDLELSALSSLTLEQRLAARGIGFEEVTWDCWVNHYSDYDWFELQSEGVVQYWEALGWTEEMWNGEADPPESDNLEWFQLSDEQLRGAAGICYFESLWQETELNDDAFATPDIDQETGAPIASPSPTNTSSSPGAMPSPTPATSSTICLFGIWSTLVAIGFSLSLIVQ